MKQLSAITVNNKKVQIQTEHCLHPIDHIRTLVYYNGKVLLKREQYVPANVNKFEIDSLIEYQHVKIENEIKEKLTSLTRQKRKQEKNSSKYFFEY